MNKNTISHYKFTLIELLVVIAIIAITTRSSINVKLEFFLFWNAVKNNPVFINTFLELIIVVCRSEEYFYQPSFSSLLYLSAPNISYIFLENKHKKLNDVSEMLILCLC